MTSDSRIHDVLRHAVDGHDLREELALQEVKAAQPTRLGRLHGCRARRRPRGSAPAGTATHNGSSSRSPRARSWPARWRSRSRCGTGRVLQRRLRQVSRSRPATGAP